MTCRILGLGCKPGSGKAFPIVKWFVPGSMIMSKKIYVVGAGAIGGLVGARLTGKLGKGNVTLIDIDEEHVKAIRDKGLRIYDKGQDNPQLEVAEVDITTPDTINKETLDNVILATKAYSNNRAVEGLREEVSILVLQNGYDERLAKFHNAARGIEFGFACQVKEPGYIFNAVKGKYVLGSSDGIHRGVGIWAELLNEAGIKAETRSNIDCYLWSKLLVNSALNPVSAVKGFSFQTLIETCESRELFKALYKEGYPIVKRKSNELEQKLGSFLGPPCIVNRLFQNQRLSDFVLKKVAKKFGEVESSMLQDVRRNRQTEIDYINGAIIRLGKEYDIATPHNNWIYQEIKNLEPKC